MTDYDTEKQDVNNIKQELLKQDVKLQVRLDLLDHQIRNEDMSASEWKIDKFKKKISTQQEEMKRERERELRAYSTAVRLSQQQDNQDIEDETQPSALITRTATYKSMKSEQSPLKTSEASPNRTFDLKPEGKQEPKGVNFKLKSQAEEKQAAYADRKADRYGSNKNTSSPKSTDKMSRRRFVLQKLVNEFRD